MKHGTLTPEIARARAQLVAVTAAAMLAALLGGVAPADAAWRGTPGKIAYLERDSGEFDLKVWTPRLHTGTAITVHEDTFHFQDDGTEAPFTNMFPSAPAWSPDGTKLAYAAKLPDNGIGNGATHTAIFVWDVRSGDTIRVTTPPDGKLDPVQGDEAELGYTHTDFAPAWSPDGQSLVYIRFISAGEDESLYGQRGGNIRKVSLTGGGATELTHLYGEQAFWGLSWGGDPAGQSRLVGYHFDKATGYRLVTIDPNSGATTTLQSGNAAAMITDFDVTADGLGVDYVRSDGTGDRRRFDGPTSPLGSGLRINAFRSSPSGNGPLHLDDATIPGVGHVLGVVERRAPDPDGDVWPEEPLDRWVNALFPEMFGRYAIGTPGRSLWDVQPQQLPIINLPGFAGSDILCGGETQWPPSATGNGERLQNMRLGEDGRTDEGCPGAGPTQDPNDDEGFVSSAFGQDIYQAQEDWIDDIAPGDRGWRFSWDWRKAPSQSMARLDALVNRALNTDFAKEQDVKRVVMYGHSYGGLLMRQYVQAHPEKVGRTLTAGTPYWGVPKPTFFISFGVENPVGGLADLDSFLPNEDAKQFARNAAGAYHLFPGDRYGRWMTIDGTFQDTAQTRAWLTGVAGANGGLLDEARAWHQQYDGFTTMQGTIEARAVVGTGLLSIGGVEVPAVPAEDGTVETRIRMVDGDITVPIQSAHQGPLGTHTPLGDPVHVQAVCKVSHMDLGGHPDVTEKYTEFLLTGRTPRKTEGPCKPSGTVLEIREFEIPAAGARVFGPVASAALDPTASLVDAAEAGDIQLIEVPGAPIAVLSDDKLVDLQLAGGDRRVNLRVTRYDDGDVSSTSTFSDLTGDVRAASGAGGALAITVDGQVVSPDASDPGGDTTDPGGGTTDPGGGTADPGGGTADPGGGTAGPGSTLATARLRLTKVRAQRRGRRTVMIAVRGRLTGPSAGRVTITATGGRLRGRGRVPVRKGVFQASLRLRGRPPRRVTVVASYAGGSTHTPARASRAVAVRPGGKQ